MTQTSISPYRNKRAMAAKEDAMTTGDTVTAAFTSAHKGMQPSLGTSEHRLDGDAARPANLSSAIIQSFPHLARETELQKMLYDERMRCEQHKTNYQTLKNEHISLQNEFLALQVELKTHLQEMKFLKENCEEAIEASERIVDEKNKEIEKLRQQLVMGRPEIIKQQVREDVEKPLKEKCLRLREEIDQCRDEFNALRYENAMLKTQLEYAQREYQANLEQMRVSSANEISSLKQLIEDIQAKQVSTKKQESKQLALLEEENSKLIHRIKALQADFEELEAEKKKFKADARLHTMHHNEMTAKLWALETDLASLKAQRDSLESELASHRQTVILLRSELKEMKDKELRLKGQMEDAEQKFKKELAEAKLGALAEKAAVERERDEAIGELKGLKLDLESEHSMVLKLEQTLEMRDKEAQARYQALKDQEWEKQHRLESEKQHLEMQLREATKAMKDAENKYKIEIDEVKEELTAVNKKRLAMEREVVILRAELEGLQSSKSEIQGMQSQNNILQEELQRLKNSISEMAADRKDLVRDREKLLDAVENTRKELEEANIELAREREAKEHALIQQQLSHSQEKQHYQRRIEDLEARIREINLKFTKETDELKTKQRQYARLITKLRNKTELAGAKQQELEIENEALRKRVPQELYAELKKQLRDLQCRHAEFSQLVGSDIVHPAAGGIVGLRDTLHPSSYSTFVATSGMVAPFPNGTQLKTRESILNAEELKALKERLEELDRQQKQQMKKLEAFSSHEYTKPKEPMLLEEDNNLDAN